MHQVIGERSLAETDVSPDVARTMLRDMVRAREFDERAVALQRRGWMSGYPPFEGQEASQVGAAHALDADDWLFPTYRTNAMQLTRGVDAADLLRFRRGYSEMEDGRDVNNFTQATPIATQLPHAVGAAMAADYRGADHAVCAYLGDGATSEGDFHEAMNFAGVFSAPVVFLCENNHWAISLPRERQTASDTIAGKARAYGFEGAQVDGMDPLAVHEAVTEGLASARGGDPVLVESLTHRAGPHTTSDDPSRYRDDPDLPGWRTADPIERFADYLRAEGVIEEGFIADARADAATAMDAAIEDAEATPDPEPAELFAHVAGEIPERLAKQRAEAGAGAAAMDRSE